MNYQIRSTNDGRKVVVFPCTRCGNRLNSLVESRGKIATCKKCKGKTVVPNVADAPVSNENANPTDPDFFDCPFCKERIRKGAKKCRFCHELLNDHGQPKNYSPEDFFNNLAKYTSLGGRDDPNGHPFLAAVMSLIIPGLGQLYKGDILLAALFFISSCLGYAMFIIPGIITHFGSIVNAATYSKKKNRNS